MPSAQARKNNTRADGQRSAGIDRGGSWHTPHLPDSAHHQTLHRTCTCGRASLSGGDRQSLDGGHKAGKEAQEDVRAVSEQWAFGMRQLITLCDLHTHFVHFTTHAHCCWWLPAVAQLPITVCQMLDSTRVPRQDVYFCWTENADIPRGQHINSSVCI